MAIILEVLYKSSCDVLSLVANLMFYVNSLLAIFLVSSSLSHAIDCRVTEGAFKFWYYLLNNMC